MEDGLQQSARGYSVVSSIQPHR